MLDDGIAHSSEREFYTLEAFYIGRKSKQNFSANTYEICINNKYISKLKEMNRNKRNLLGGNLFTQLL